MNDQDVGFKFNAGDPIKLTQNETSVYCRFVKSEGGLFHFVTPHGSPIVMGFFYVVQYATKIESAEDHAKLARFEELAANYQVGKACPE